jgi:hypothetical protein
VFLYDTIKHQTAPVSVSLWKRLISGMDLIGFDWDLIGISVCCVFVVSFPKVPYNKSY